MDWSKITAIEIPEGNVTEIRCGEKVLWKKVVGENRWNLLGRTEFRGDTSRGTYYFNPNEPTHTMPMSEDVWFNGGRCINPLCYFYANGYDFQDVFSTLTDITDDGFTMISGTRVTALSVAFPFHLYAGDTIKVTFTRSGFILGGYEVFNTDGTHRSFYYEQLPNKPGTVKTYEFTAPDECWFAWVVGQYDKGATVTVSNISVTVRNVN